MGPHCGKLFFRCGPAHSGGLHCGRLRSSGRGAAGSAGGRGGRDWRCAARGTAVHVGQWPIAACRRRTVGQVRRAGSWASTPAASRAAAVLQTGAWERVVPRQQAIRRPPRRQRRRLPRRPVRRPLLVVRRSRSGMRWKCRARHARAGDVGGALSRCATGRAALGLLVESGSTVTYYGKEGMSQAWGALKNACRCWPSAARCCRQRSAARAGTAARHAGRSAAFVRWRVVESKSEASLRLVGLGSFEMQVHGE